jgi:NitT/TauT family transport system ATP-binding protein
VAAEGADVTDPPAHTIRFEKVSRRFTTPARGDVWALREISFSCCEGELTCVLGPSGCGKTTVLRLAAGLDRPTSGRVLLDGRTVAGPPEGLGMVSQEGSLLPWRRVLGNVALGLEIRGVARRRRRERVREVLRRVHLPPSIERSYPHELSGGMRQRVALARALCPNPRILLMDEPFASVDEPTRHRLQAELLDLWLADRQTVLFVTHSIEEAAFLADRIIVMTFGRTVESIPVKIDRPRNRLSEPFVQTLLRIRRALAEQVDRAEPWAHDEERR